MELGLDILTTKHTDTKACNHNGPATFYLAVYGYKNSSYSITAVQANSSVVLRDGQSQRGYVHHGDYNYYELHLGYEKEDEALEISINPDFGDPDLYITTDGRKPSRYTTGGCIFSSRRVGTLDMLTLDRRSDETAECMEACLSTRNCVIRIAVYGYRTSGYKIMASTRLAPVELTGNLPAMGFVAAGEYRHYKIRKSSDTSMLTFLLTPLGGDPDLVSLRCFWRTMCRGGRERRREGAREGGKKGRERKKSSLS